MVENAARVDWAGVGVRLPRRWPPRGAARGRARAGGRPTAARAREVAAWAAAHDGATAAAGEVERWAARVAPATAAPEAVR